MSDLRLPDEQDAVLKQLIRPLSSPTIPQAEGPEQLLECINSVCDDRHWNPHAQQLRRD